jgi:hypothetical protein
MFCRPVLTMIRYMEIRETTTCKEGLALISCTAVQVTIFYSEVSMTTLYHLGMEIMIDDCMPATAMTYYKVGLELITLIVVVDSI